MQSNFDPNNPFAQALRSQAYGGAGQSPQGGFGQIALNQQSGDVSRGIQSQIASSRALSPAQGAGMNDFAQALAGQRQAAQAEQMKLMEQQAAQEDWMAYQRAQDQQNTQIYGLESQTNINQNQYDLAAALAKAKQHQTGAGAVFSGIGSAFGILGAAS